VVARQVQDGESSLADDRRSTAVPRKEPWYGHVGRKDDTDRISCFTVMEIDWDRWDIRENVMGWCIGGCERFFPRGCMVSDQVEAENEQATIWLTFTLEILIKSTCKYWAASQQQLDAVCCYWQVDSAFYPPWDGKMSTSQRAVMFCGWGVKAGMV